MMARQTFNDRIKKYKSVLVTCPECLDDIPFDHFYRVHASEIHDIKSRTQCVFCLGEYSWQHGQKWKLKNSKHIFECLENFLKENRVEYPLDETPMETDETKTYSICDPCQKQNPLKSRDMCGRVKDNELIDYYNPVFEKPEMWTTEDDRGCVKFSQKTGLGGEEYAIVNRFQKQDLKWYHIMVKHNNFETFVREMKKIHNDIVILPIWCLCDGLRGGVSHRHMILAAALESGFRDVWGAKVKYDDSSEKGKYCKEIKNELHLVTAMRYVSQTKAACDGCIPEDLTTETKTTESHFHINRPMCKHAIVYLCTLFEGGIEQFLLRCNKNKNVVQWMTEAIKMGGNYKKWYVPIRVTGWKYIDCMIPVDKCYEPTDDEEESDFCIYLLKYKPLYFKRNEELLNLSNDEWFMHQVAKGNTFRSIGEEFYELSRTQQHVANQVKEMEDVTRRSLYSGCNKRIERVKKERDYYKNETEQLKKERDSYKNENANLKREAYLMGLNNVKSELASMKAELMNMKTEWKVVTVQFQLSMAQLKEEITKILTNALSSKG